MADGVDKPEGGRSGIHGAIAELDRLLRGELTRVSSLERGVVEIVPGRLSLVIIVLCMVYGACMGTYALFSPKGVNAWQVLASMVKVPALFYLTLVVTLPSLYVFNALVGSRLYLATVIRLLVATLGVNVAVLASLGPIVAFFSVSTTSYPFMVLFNVVTFAVAGMLGQLFLLQTLHRLNLAQGQAEAAEPAATPASARSEPGAVVPLNDQVLSRHVKTIFRLWLVVFGLVGAQMGWVLRPFIGNPNIPFSWFRGRESNFFQAVLHTFANLFN
jgi:hypothetical protein